MPGIKRQFHTSLEGLFQLQDRMASPRDLDIDSVYLVADIGQQGWAAAEYVWKEFTIDHSAGTVTTTLIDFDDTREHVHRMIAMQYNYPAGAVNASFSLALTTPAGNQITWGINSSVVVGDKVYSYDAQNSTTRQNLGYVKNAIVPPNSKLHSFVGNGGAGAVASVINLLALRVPLGNVLPQ